MTMNEILLNASEVQAAMEEDMSEYAIGIVHGIFVGFMFGVACTIIGMLTY